MNLYLVRHGESEANAKRVVQGQLDTPLTENGRWQAQRVGMALSHVKADVILSSDLVRAFETAQIIQKYLIPVTIRPSILLRERALGKVEGIPSSHSPINNTNGIESISAFLNRVSQFLYDLFEECENHEVIIVTHGGPLSALVSIACLVDFDTQYPMRLIPNGSITVFRPFPNLHFFADTKHFR